MSYYPKYQMVIDSIIKQIHNKELSGGDRISSENELAKMHGVSNITIRKAMSELVAYGLIYRIKGKGTFVSDGSAPEEKQHRLVAFLFPGRSLGGNAYMQFIVNMQRHLLAHDCSLIIENTDADQTNEILSIKKLIAKNVKGFIFYCEDPAKSIPGFRLLDEKNIPFVLIDRNTHLYPAHYVGSNNHDGAFNAVRHLINQGHREIAYIANRIHLSSEKERYDGYQDAHISAGLSVNPEYLFVLDSSSTCYERLLEYVKEGRVTAVVTVNDKSAIDVMHRIRLTGFRIPEDISIVGFDDSDILKETMIPLTTVKQYFDDIGYEAAKLLSKNMEEGRQEFSHIKLGTKLMIRESTISVEHRLSKS